MKVTIKNLGSIQNNKQSIDLTKKFYFFVGDNNSGKTYVSQLLWTIFNQKIILKFSEQINLKIKLENKDQIEIDKELVDEILNGYAHFLKSELANTYNIENTPYQETVLGKFSLSFAYDLSQVKLGKIQATSKISIEKNTPIDFFAIQKEENSLTLYFDYKYTESYFAESVKNDIEKLNLDKSDTRKTLLVSSILQLLLNHKHNTVFLPASRTFYPTFYQYIYEFEREQSQNQQKKLQEAIDDYLKTKKKVVKPRGIIEVIENIRNTYKKPYSEPINELFRKLYNFNKSIEVVNYYDHLIEKITKLMGGSIVMSSVEGISMIDFLFKINRIEKDLPMYMSSSSANQMTLLHIYFKYWADEKANFLMIDEPEENLNPKNQIKLLEILIEFANQNDNKVLITTHSPVLAEAVNNYLYLDVLKNDFKLNLNDLIENNNLKYLNPDISISNKNIGVYFFSGDRIVDYADGEEYGVFFRDFKDVTKSVDRNSKVLTDYIYLKQQEVNGEK